MWAGVSCIILELILMYFRIIVSYENVTLYFDICLADGGM